MRVRIRRYAAEGHDVETAADMKTALDNDGGVQSVQTSVVAFDPVQMTMPKWQGIQHLYNFR